MKRTFERPIVTVVCLAAVILSATRDGFAGILYGGGQPIESNFSEVLDRLDQLERDAGDLKRRYLRVGAADGSRLAEQLSDQALALREEISRLERGTLDARTVLDVQIASSMAVDVLGSVRESLGLCRSCNLGFGAFDSVDRALEDFTVKTAVLRELLPLVLLPDFSRALPAPSIPSTVPPITGGRPPETGLPSLADEVARLLDTYRRSGDSRGAELARGMAIDVEVLVSAIDIVVDEIPTENLGPQNAGVVLDAFADIRDALARLEQQVSRADDCCQTVPGLLTPVRTLLAHVRVQSGALADAAADSITPEVLEPEDGEPVLQSTLAELLRGAIAGGQPILEAAGSIYRRLGSARGAELTRSDAISILTYLFDDGARTICLKAADSNDDGSVDISDVLPILAVLFLGGAAIPEPSTVCGEDPTPDALPCAMQPTCLERLP